MSDMAKVSVIIPTYNRPGFLHNAISSVRGQSFQDFAIVVVDDGSEANINEIVHAFDDQRISYIRHATNRGGAAARNTGVINTSSPYVAFLDDDDEWFPNKLQMQLDLLEHGSLRLGGVYTGYLEVERKSGEVLCLHTPTKRGDLFTDLLERNWIGGTSSMLLRRECFSRVGLFDESLPSFQDYDLWIRISREFEFDYVGVPLLKYQLHPRKISSSFDAQRNGIEIMLKKYARYPTFRKSFSKQLSYTCLDLGVRYCEHGNVKTGKEALLLAVKLFPFEMRYYFYLCLASLGGSSFRRLTQVKDVIMHPLRKRMASS